MVAMVGAVAEGPTLLEALVAQGLVAVMTPQKDRVEGACSLGQLHLGFLSWVQLLLCVSGSSLCVCMQQVPNQALSACSSNVKYQSEIWRSTHSWATQQ